MPRRGDGDDGDSKPHHVPPPSKRAQLISARFRTNQPSSAGTSPTSVSSILASCTPPQPRRSGAAALHGAAAWVEASGGRLEVVLAEVVGDVVAKPPARDVGGPDADSGLHA